MGQPPHQPVTPQRFNVFAVKGRAEILLTTHIDTVPPFFASFEDENFLYGRGACDAKGIAAAMICAAQELVEEGKNDVGLLLVVGEETDSAGALKARELVLKCTYLIDGEPTDNELVVGPRVWFTSVFGLAVERLTRPILKEGNPPLKNS